MSKLKSGNDNNACIEKEYQKFITQSKKAHRVTTLGNAFENIASGRSMVPNKYLVPDVNLLHNDQDLIAFAQYCVNNLGAFMHHAYTSIPYFLENDIRIASAIHKYYNSRYSSSNQPFCFYEPSGATGMVSRVLSTFSNNEIECLCDSVTTANKFAFNKLKEPKSSAKFYHGVYTDITLEFLAKHQELKGFANGFDIIFERCTLQFYGSNRYIQLYHFKKILKNDGVLILMGKYLQPVTEDYYLREKFKDDHFKSKYFNSEEILKKKIEVLNTMENGQVTLETMTKAISQHFKHVVIIWSCTNFYTLLVSNSDSNIVRLISNMRPPCLPEKFNFDGKMPRVVLGLEDHNLKFKK